MESGNSSPNKKSSKIVVMLLFLIIALLIFNNIRLSARLNDVQRRIDNITFSQMQDMSALRSDIWRGMDQIRHELEQSTRLASDVIVSVRSFNGADLTADVDVSFFLREFSAGDVVSVNASEYGEQQLISTVASQSESGRFSANMILPLAGNFSLSFIAEGPTIRSGALADVFLADELCDRFRYSLGQGISTFRNGGRGSMTISVTPFLINSTQGDESLAIRDIYLSLESFEGAAIRSWDLTSFLCNEDSSFQILLQDSMWEEGNWELFEIPVREQDSTGEAENLYGRDYVMPGEVVVARLVIYDYLGIRYEQSSQIYVPDGMIGGFASHGIAALPGTINRVIEYGEHSWDFIRIVRRHD